MYLDVHNHYYENFTVSMFLHAVGKAASPLAERTVTSAECDALLVRKKETLFASRMCGAVDGAA